MAYSHPCSHSPPAAERPFHHGLLCDLFSRAGVNSVLQSDWQEIIPMLDTGQWQLTRDLALLGFASYAGSGATAPKQEDTDAATPDGAE